MAEKNAYESGWAEQPPERFFFTKPDAKLILAYFFFSFVAFLLGAIAGLLQALDRGDYISIPPQFYYLMLTLHGVALALIFTTFFIVSYLYSGVVKTTGGEMRPRDRTIG